ncbi:uncharacterized protein C8R40DRAFT_1173770 [Lentinula edodes]|uniref:uncharacterized protein n=1 Tax=Lentinula edodes TaxID=5353 RepID=UPI001E8DCB2E|nr:uncharacterized protein C8R40DRAFT_1173770 [Lentinula edodes]KAH7872368.1 hypothetical protein C8R40DRAFT_1173770 [Lentinula edodes]
MRVILQNASGFYVGLLLILSALFTVARPLSAPGTSDSRNPDLLDLNSTFQSQSNVTLSGRSNSHQETMKGKVTFGPLNNRGLSDNENTWAQLAVRALIGEAKNEHDSKHDYHITLDFLNQAKYSGEVGIYEFNVALEGWHWLKPGAKSRLAGRVHWGSGTQFSGGVVRGKISGSLNYIGPDNAIYFEVNERPVEMTLQ